MDRDWMSEEVVAAILEALADEVTRIAEIAAKVRRTPPEMVARHVGVMAADGLLTRREVDGHDVYACVVS